MKNYRYSISNKINSNYRYLKGIFITILLWIYVVLNLGQLHAADRMTEVTQSGKANILVSKIGGGSVVSISVTTKKKTGEILCGKKCSQDFDINKVLMLGAIANSGSTFVRWGGACKGTNKICTIRVGKNDLKINAVFKENNTNSPIIPKTTNDTSNSNGVITSNSQTSLSSTQSSPKTTNVPVPNTGSPIFEGYTYAWSPENWGSCSLSCGSGMKTRKVNCLKTITKIYSKNTDSVKTSEIADDKYCANLPKPTSSQACNTQSCDTTSIQ